MQASKFLNFPLLFVLLSLLTLSACSEKATDTQKTTSSTSEEVKTASGEKPALARSYTALFAKAGEDVKNALARNPNNFRDGQHFTTLAGKHALVGNGEKIEVVEFFSYGCPACFNAEASMHAYAEQVKEDVEFVRVPVSFNPQYETLARGYYAANALGVEPEAHIALFDAIHEKRQSLYSTRTLANFYSHYGVDKALFKKTVDSFSVNSLIQRDKKLAQAYQVSGVPTVIVNGKYNTGGRKAGNMDAWVQILDFLTEKERAKKAWTK